MVRDRFPKEKLYGYVWNRYGLFGQNQFLRPGDGLPGTLLSLAKGLVV